MNGLKRYSVVNFYVSLNEYGGVRLSTDNKEEAEAFAAEDKKKKEEVETRNAADQMVYQTEKSMNEFGDKVTQADKDSVNPKLEALKEALKGTDTEAIKKAQEELQTAFYAVAERIYKEQGAAAQQAEAQTNVSGEGTNSASGSDRCSGRRHKCRRRF